MSDAVAVAAVHNHLDEAMGQGHTALICYLPLGDPRIPEDAVDRYVEAGVDVLEIGLPVPNPYVDGKIVRDSMRRALRAGVTPESSAEAIARIRERHPDIGMVWMSYGAVVDPDRWVRLARLAGVDALLFPESARHFGALQERLALEGMHLCHFLSRELPRSDVDAARTSSGYIMLQAVAARTGGGDPRAPLPDSSALIRRLRRNGVQTPIALGIGISTPKQARQAAGMGASGVIVGTASVAHATRGKRALSRFLDEMRSAL